MTADFYQSIVENLSDAIIALDKQGFIQVFNKKAEELLGYQRDEMIGKNAKMLFPSIRSKKEKMEKYLSDGMINVIQNGRRIQMIRKDGTFLTVDIHANQSNTLTGMLYVGIIREVTGDDVSAPLSLDQYHRIFRELPIPVIIVQNGKILSVNKSLLNIFGYDESEDLIGRKTFDILDPRVHAMHQKIGKMRESGVEMRHVYYSVGLTKDKQPFRIKVHANRILLKGGDAIFAVLENVSQEEKYLKSIEQMNQKLQTSNRFLENFGYVASHDLKEPLRKINSFGQILRENIPNLSEENATYFDFMIDGAMRMQKLIDGLLELSRVSSTNFNFQKVDIGKILNELINNDLSQIIHKTNASIKLDLAVFCVLGMERLIYIVFTNILNNALKFTTSKPYIKISSQLVGNKVVIKFADKGIGFSAEYTEDIFQMFKRLHSNDYKGMGIGLSIVRESIERLQGKITVESKVNEGTTFIIELQSCSGDE